MILAALFLALAGDAKVTLEGTAREGAEVLKRAVLRPLANCTPAERVGMASVLKI